MVDIGLALVGWLVIGWLPGFAILIALRPGAGTWRNATLAPLVAVGVDVGAARGLQALGAPVRPAVVLPVALGVALLAWAWRVRTTARRRGPALRPSRADLALLLLAVCIGAVVWSLAVRSPAAVLPNDDGTHHGVFAYRILKLATLDPRRVTAGDITSSSPSSSYYPLALHLVTALISGATGAPVSLVFTVGLVLSAAVVLPVGTCILIRRLCPQLPVAAGIGAVLSVSLAWFPYGPLSWGGVPTVMAMCMVPIALDTVWPRAEDGPAWSLGLCLGIAGFGVFESHNSELVTIGLFGVLITAGNARIRSAAERRRILRSWAVGVVVLLVLISPELSSLVGGASEASGFYGNKVGGGRGTNSSLIPVTGGTAVRDLISPVVLVAAFAGLVIALRRRWLRGLAACLAATVVLAVGTALHPPVLRALTAPWYEATLRISYLFSYLEVIYAAVALAVLFGALAAVRARTVAAAGLVAIVAAGLAAVQLPDTARFADLAYRHNSLDGADQRAAFAWLAAHLGRGQRVLNQFSDGSGWMLPLRGVTPVFATKPGPLGSTGGWGDRLYLLDHAADLATDPLAQHAVREWQVRYVYINGESFDGSGLPRLAAAALSASPGYREVWRHGPVVIFEVLRS